MKSERFQITRIYVPAKHRRRINPDVVREIAESILEIGQQTPIQVRADGDRFVLVEGLQRLEACRALGEETIAGFLVLAKTGSDAYSSDAEANLIRQKTERLRQLRLAKEAEEWSSGTSAKAVVAETSTRRRFIQPQKSERLADWLAERDSDGFRR